MANELKLKLLLQEKENTLDDCKKRYISTRKELDNVETNLINAKEAKRRAMEDLEEFQRRNVLENSVQENDDLQIAEYKVKMPALLTSISHEPPIPYRSISDLDTIPNWPNKKK